MDLTKTEKSRIDEVVKQAEKEAVGNIEGFDKKGFKLSAKQLKEVKAVGKAVKEKATATRKAEKERLKQVAESEKIQLKKQINFLKGQENSQKKNIEATEKRIKTVRDQITKKEKRLAEINAGH